jgi:hypothetical protein
MRVVVDRFDPRNVGKQIDLGAVDRLVAREKNEAGQAGRAGQAGWAGEPGEWDRDEWDVALSDGAVYRIFRDRASDAWFIEAIVD